MKKLQYKIKRKVQKQFKIAIPKEFVDSNQIREGQEVILEYCDSHIKIWFSENDSK